MFPPTSLPSPERASVLKTYVPPPSTKARRRWVEPVALVLVFVGALVWLLGADGSSVPSAVFDRTTMVRTDQVDEFDRRHRQVTFMTLSSFEYFETPQLAGVPTSSARETIPEEIRKLNGTRVSVDGFMLPLDFDNGGVSQFILNASFDMCQFGAPTVVTQRVDVAMTNSRRTGYTHTPIRVYGLLEVGEEYQDGRVVSIYRMKADAVWFGEGF
jgi:hypothetical protein